MIELVVDIKCLQSIISINGSPLVTKHYHLSILVHVLNTIISNKVSQLRLNIIGKLSTQLVSLESKFDILYHSKLSEYISSLEETESKYVILNWCSSKNDKSMWGSVYINSRIFPHIRIVTLPYNSNKWNLTKHSSGLLHLKYVYWTLLNHSLLMYICHILPYLVNLKTSKVIYIIRQSKVIYIGFNVMVEDIEFALKQGDSFYTMSTKERINVTQALVTKLSDDFLKANDTTSYDLTDVNLIPT